MCRKDILGVSDTDDLYEVAGCLMRLALWPTEYLWSLVSDIYQQVNVSVPLYQVATHFRCGDNKFSCKFDPNNKSPYQSALYPFGVGNPIQLGECARQVITNSSRKGDF